MPQNHALHFERGLVCMELQRPRDAYDCFVRATKVNPSFQPAFVNTSAILEQQERFEEAMQWARKAAELKPDCPLAQYNLANTLRECGRVAEAIEHYERSAKLNPDYAKAKWNLGICHVLVGQFAEAWPMFELREVAEDVKIDKYTQPRWDGSSLTGKTIVIHAEQGIGDEVLFASCFGDVIAQAGKTIIVCEPRLANLFARSFPAATVHGWARRKDWSPMPFAERIDFQIPAGSLPLFLRNTPESFPQRDSFLIPDAARVAQWKLKLAQLGRGLKIGLSWRAGGKANEGRKRTIPLIEWRDILQTPGAHFVNLQYSDASEDLAAVKNGLGVTVHDWEEGDPLVDLDSYAAKIAALDLVISVGNAAVHLAGAVGTTAWTLLPRVPSWRWMVTGEVSPWYSSVRLFRQPKRREWTPVLEQIAVRLGDVAKKADGELAGDRIKSEIRAVMPQNEPPDAASLDPPADLGEAWMDAKELGNRQPHKLIEQYQQEAEAALRVENFAEAERLYREILSITPRHLKSHVGLGLVARETGRFDLAIRSLRRALNQYEPHAVNHTHLAAALTDAGRGADALNHARRAISLDAKYGLAQLELGRALQATGEHVAAMEAFNRALELSPGDAAAIAALSRSLIASGRIDQAMQMLRQAVKSSPGQPQYHLALGEALLEDQCFDEAERCLQKAIEFKPTLGEAHYQLARLLKQREEFSESIAANQRAVEFRPQWAAAWTHLAELQSAVGNFEACEVAFRRAVEFKPQSAELRSALAKALAEQGDHEQAVAECDRALQLQPTSAPVHVQRAHSLLQLGRLAEGWDELEWRLQPAGENSQFQLGAPHWDGSSLQGRSIAIISEGGPAEQIMFATCYPEVIRDAGKCVIVCPANFERLLRRSFSSATVLGFPAGAMQNWRLPAQITLDAQCAAGSLSRHLRRSADAFPKHARVLIADPEKVAAWQQRMAALGAGMKIGIAVQQGLQPTRQTESLTAWQPLLTAPGIQWIALDKRNERGLVQKVISQFDAKLRDWPDAVDLADADWLAAQIAAVDLVITADNAVAHLAGALGVPAWVVLERRSAWHWLADADDSGWYASVRLFRQSTFGDLRDLFRRLREELLKTTFRLDEQSKIGRPHASFPNGGATLQQSRKRHKDHSKENDEIRMMNDE